MDNFLIEFCRVGHYEYGRRLIISNNVKKLSLELEKRYIPFITLNKDDSSEWIFNLLGSKITTIITDELTSVMADICSMMLIPVTTLSEDVSKLSRSVDTHDDSKAGNTVREAVIKYLNNIYPGEKYSIVMGGSELESVKHASKNVLVTGRPKISKKALLKAKDELSNATVDDFNRTFKAYGAFIADRCLPENDEYIIYEVEFKDGFKYVTLPLHIKESGMGYIEVEFDNEVDDTAKRAIMSLGIIPFNYLQDVIPKNKILVALYSLSNSMNKHHYKNLDKWTGYIGNFPTLAQVDGIKYTYDAAHPDEIVTTRKTNLGTIESFNDLIWNNQFECDVLHQSRLVAFLTTQSTFSNANFNWMVCYKLECLNIHNQYQSIFFSNNLMVRAMGSMLREKANIANMIIESTYTKDVRQRLIKELGGEVVDDPDVDGYLPYDKNLKCYYRGNLDMIPVSISGHFINLSFLYVLGLASITTVVRQIEEHMRMYSQGATRRYSDLVKKNMVLEPDRIGIFHSLLEMHLAGVVAIMIADELKLYSNSVKIKGIDEFSNNVVYALTFNRYSKPFKGLSDKARIYHSRYGQQHMNYRDTKESGDADNDPGSGADS